MVVPVPLTDPITQLHLPPGFRFNPTDVELIVHYLFRKITGQVFPLQIIGDVDLYKFNPWELPSKATFGDKEWYFFSPRDRKYRNGFRPNRVAGSGYWKATGTDKAITSERGKVGVKKALVFYVGKAPKGSKTNWIMHEYRLSEPTTKNNSTRLDDWVLCRIYKKNSTAEKTISGGSPSSASSNIDDVTTNNSMSNEDWRVAKFNSGGYEWMSVGVFGLHDPITEWMSVGVFGLHDPITDNDRVNSTFVDRAFEMQMGFGESPDGEVNAGIRSQRVGSSGCMFSQSCTSRTDPFAIRYPTRQGGSGYDEESE